MAKRLELLRLVLALGRRRALGDVGKADDEAAIGHRARPDLDDLARRRMMLDRPGLAGAVPRKMAGEMFRDERLEPFGRDRPVAFAGEHGEGAAVEGADIVLGIEHENGVGDIVDSRAEMLLAALQGGDVGIGPDRVAVGRLALGDHDPATVAEMVLEHALGRAMRPQPFADPLLGRFQRLDVLLPPRRDANEMLEGDARLDDVRDRGEDLAVAAIHHDEAIVLVEQREAFLERFDRLPEAHLARHQIGFAALLFGDVYDVPQPRARARPPLNHPVPALLAAGLDDPLIVAVACIIRCRPGLDERVDAAIGLVRDDDFAAGIENGKPVGKLSMLSTRRPSSDWIPAATGTTRALITPQGRLGRARRGRRDRSAWRWRRPRRTRAPS